MVESRLHVADILHDMGDRTQALAVMEQASRLQEKQVREYPRNPEYRDRLLFINYNLRWLRDGGRLLQEPSVQKELNLSKELIQQITRTGGKTARYLP